MALGEKLREARLRKKLTTSEVAAATRMKMQTVEAIEREDFSKMAAPIYCKGFIKLYSEFMGIDPDPLVAEYVAKCAESKPAHLTPPDEEALPPIETALPHRPSSEHPKADHADMSAHSERPGETGPGDQFTPAQAPAMMPADETSGPSLLDRGRAFLVNLLRKIPVLKAPAQEGVTAAPPPAEGEPGDQEQPVLMNGTLKTASIIFGTVIIIIFLVSILSRCSKPSDTAEPVTAKPAKELKIEVPPPAVFAD